MPRESLIQIYRSTTASNAPSLTAGELAVNIPDKKLFVGGTSGNITFLDASAHVTTVNGLTSAITITGSGAITQTVSGTTTTFGARLASSSATGVASFGNQFTVSAAGAVGLTSNYVTSFNGATGAVLADAVTWSVITTDTTAVVNRGYFTNKATLLNIYLPNSPQPVGSAVRVSGMNAGLWKIQAQGYDVIHFGKTSTISSGYLASTHARDSVELVCCGFSASANSWNVVSSIGNIEIA
jgi:hypothetical protein